MTNPARPDTVAGLVNAGRSVLAGDVARRRPAATGPERLVYDPVPPFSLGGTLFLSTSSPWRAIARRFSIVDITLTTAGTSTTTVSIKKNGVSQGTAGIASGVTATLVGLSFTTAADDRVTVEITAVGTGAAGITVVLR